MNKSEWYELPPVGRGADQKTRKAGVGAIAINSETARMESRAAMEWLHGTDSRTPNELLQELC